MTDVFLLKKTEGKNHQTPPGFGNRETEFVNFLFRLFFFLLRTMHFIFKGKREEGIKKGGKGKKIEFFNVKREIKEKKFF